MIRALLPIFKIKDISQNILVKNFFFLLLDHILSQILMFFAYSLLARTISVEKFGIFGFAQAYYNYFFILINIGLPIYGIKQYALLKSSKQRIRLINHIISIRFILFILLVLPYIGIAFLFAHNSVTVRLILLMGLSLILMVFNLEWYFRAVQKMQYLALGNILRSLFFLAGIFFFISGDSDLIYIGIIFSLSFIIPILIFLMFSNHIPNLRLIFHDPLMIPIFRESLILGLSLILIQVYYNFGLIILGVTRSNMEVGYFTTLHKLTLFFLAIITLYLKTVFPHMAALANDSKRLNNFVIKLTKFSTIFSLVVVGTLILIAKPLIVLLFGEKYLSSVGPFRILIIVFFIISARVLIENSLIILNKSGKYLKAVLAGALTNIVLNLTFSPFFGIYAVAIIAVISEIVFSIIAFYYSDIKLKSLLVI